MQMPLERQNDVSLRFAPPIEKLADLGEPRLELLQLSRLQFYLPACVGDLHALSRVPDPSPERPTSFIARLPAAPAGPQNKSGRKPVNFHYNEGSLCGRSSRRWMFRQRAICVWRPEPS